MLPIALNRSKQSFKPDDSSNLTLDLTFTNVSAARIAETYTVYFEIDDKAGSNYVRRQLPTVDFRQLSPGKPVTFSDTLRVAAFPPGQYTISLWIPDADPARTFDPAYNYLLSNADVPAPDTGLNVIAHFTVD